MPRSKEGKKRPKVPPDVLKAAVAAIRTENLKVRVAARRFGLSRTTLQRHIDNHNKRGDSEFQYVSKSDYKRVFNEDEEKSLAEYLIQACQIHYGLTRRGTCMMAYEFAKTNNKLYPISWNKDLRAGKQWYADFMRRHRNTLSLRKPEATSLARATAFNKNTVSIFFSKLKDVMDRYKFLPQSIYNMDETGLTTVHKPDKVVAPRGSKQVGTMTSGEKGPTVTLVGCVNAIGQSIPPLLIYPRVHVQKYMLFGAPPGTICAANPSGWINSNIFVAFLHHFIQYAKPGPENPVLLILDNHETHITIEAINLAKSRGIVMLTIPPHTSHKLQPLDRGVYGPLKTYFNSASANWLRNNPGVVMTIHNMSGLVGQVYPQAFTPINVMAGFRVSGIWPLNENTFSDDEFLSSAVTDREFVENSPGNVTEEIVVESVEIPKEPLIKTTPDPTASGSGLSPFQVKPLPKALPRKTSNRGRKRGRCRILTDTPEKALIEAAAQSKAMKLTATQRGRKRVFSSTDSTEDDEINNVVIDLLEEQSEEQSAEALRKLLPGDFCVSKLLGKKNVKYYVTEILNSTELHLFVNYYTKLPKHDVFICKDKEPYLISPNDVVCKLPEPAVVGTNARRQLKFSDSILENYKLE